MFDCKSHLNLNSLVEMKVSLGVSVVVVLALLSFERVSADSSSEEEAGCRAECVGIQCGVPKCDNEHVLLQKPDACCPGCYKFASKFKLTKNART